MDYTDMTLECADDVAVITLNRPDRLNALSDAMRASLAHCYETLRTDDAIRVVVMTGAGRGFCAGADMGSFGRARPEPGWAEMLDELRAPGHRTLAQHHIGKPMIAAVNGVAAGAGFSMALACDIRVGSENARFKSVFVERNLAPDTGLSYYLPRIAGAGAAMDITLTARFVEAQEAKELGILQRLVPHDRLLAEALALARTIASHPPLAVQVTRRVMQQSWDNRFEDQLRYEMRATELARQAANDAKEATAAFLEKRTPRYTGH